MPTITDGTTRAILRSVEALGYQVFSFPHAVEFHVVRVLPTPDLHVARVDDTGPEAEYRAACELAQSVGIDLEDG
jgi:hypothetical protein